MKNLRCAVVGVGYLGRFHAQKYQKADGVELVGVCDLNSDQAKKVADELKVQSFSNPKELIGKIDAVTIAAATKAHFELCQIFLNNGIHVFVEKPIASTSREGEEICRLAKEKKLKFQVGHIERFNPTFRALKEKIQKPLYIESRRVAPFKTRGADVSVIHDMMVHDLDLIRALVNSNIRSIKATGGKVMMPTYDFAGAMIEFENGAVAHITASRIDHQIERAMKVFAQNGLFKADLGSGTIVWSQATDESKKNSQLEVKEWTVDKVDALQIETQSFVNMVRNDLTPEVTGEDGVEALRWAEKVADAIKGS